jgi:hypothetical protein
LPSRDCGADGRARCARISTHFYFGYVYGEEGRNSFSGTNFLRASGGWRAACLVGLVTIWRVGVQCSHGDFKQRVRLDLFLGERRVRRSRGLTTIIYPHRHKRKAPDNPITSLPVPCRPPLPSWLAAPT